MIQAFDVILKGAVVVNHDGEGVRDLGIKDGRIAAAGETIDCRGLHILPGVIDTQVHFREPGLAHKEDLETGSRAAVLGGVTAVFEMPNTDPQTTTAEALADKVRRGHHRMHCDFAFFVGGTHENVAALPELERLPGAAGVKVFMGSSTGSLLVEDDEGVRGILKAIRRRASFHSEDEYRLRERRDQRIEGDPRSHPVWRDEIAAPLHRAAHPACARDGQPRPCAAHQHRAGDGIPCRPQGSRFGRGDPDASDARSARVLRAARHAGAAQSAGARRGPPCRALARACAGHRRCPRLRSFPAHAG